ncbi:MAG: hypothetical protein QOJ99_3283 [Bryobacterales bacterium]|nr:hypothetical protein [Bryobacterales bacterium]
MGAYDGFPGRKPSFAPVGWPSPLSQVSALVATEPALTPGFTLGATATLFCSATGSDAGPAEQKGRGRNGRRPARSCTFTIVYREGANRISLLRYAQLVMPGCTGCWLSATGFRRHWCRFGRNSTRILRFSCSSRSPTWQLLNKAPVMRITAKSVHKAGLPLRLTGVEIKTADLTVKADFNPKTGELAMRGPLH